MTTSSKTIGTKIVPTEEAPSCVPWAALGWPDISDVPENEIKLLIQPGGMGLSLDIEVQDEGEFYSDIEGSTMSYSSGTNEWWIDPDDVEPLPSGQRVKVVRFWSDSPILGFGVARPAMREAPIHTPILAAVLNLPHAYNFNGAFGSDLWETYSYAMVACEIKTLESAQSVDGMFMECSTLQYVKLPDSWNDTLSSLSSMFLRCKSLTHITLPENWGASITNINNLFRECRSLVEVNLPESWGNVTYVSDLFHGCSLLTRVNFPSNLSIRINFNAQRVFKDCYSLVEVTNLSGLGSSVSDTNFSSFISHAESFKGVLEIGSRVSRISLLDDSNNWRYSEITGLRLLNANSVFSGASPHVNVKGCKLNAQALNTLFGDLPTRSNKTINITDCPGAATCTRSIATAKGWTVTG